MQRLFLKILPYIICILTGIIVFLFEKFTIDPDIKNMVINISSGLISVPFVFISYELVKNITEQKIRARITGYIKFHVEKSLFGMLKYFYTWFFPTEKMAIILTDAKLNFLFDMETLKIERFFMERKMLGFFVYKDISPFIEELSSIIKNPNINSYISTDEMVRFMDILRNITLIKKETLDFINEDKDTRFTIKNDPNPNNSELTLTNGNIQIDSGEFGNLDKEKLTEYFRVPTEDIELVAKQIHELLFNIEEILEIMNIDFWNENYPYDIKNPNS